MTILAELAALYERRAERAGWPRPGYSTEKIGAVVVLNEDGSVAHIGSLMAPDEKGKLQPRAMAVPKAVTRTAGIKPNLFWDKSAYSLGVTAMVDENGNTFAGQGKRTVDEHEAFRTAHREMLEGTKDAGLTTFRYFVESWAPEGFSGFAGADALLDENVVFQLGEGGPFVHGLPAVEQLLQDGAADAGMCLITGKSGSVARLHPAIKGVMGAQSSGASLVSFNDTAYESHGKKQGDNAPASEGAVFAYGTALNALLARGSGNNLRIGDATVVFWAKGSTDAAEREAEEAAFGVFAGSDEIADNEAERHLRDKLEELAKGRVPPATQLDPGTRLFVLGLSPNAARLSVRFWYPGTLGDLARNVTQFWAECDVHPSPFVKGDIPTPPKPWALLYDLAAQRKADNIPNGLGGELMRAILTGLPYPATLLTAIVGRLRVEGEPDPKDRAMDGRRAAMLRAYLKRNLKREVPMALDEGASDPAYLLGRLFAAYTYAEKSYQNRGAGLRQKYMGSASATPARVFPVLMRGYEHNLAALLQGKGANDNPDFSKAAGRRADDAVNQIAELRDGAEPLPPTLNLNDQAIFFIGFYHQWNRFFEKRSDAVAALSKTSETETAE